MNLRTVIERRFRNIQCHTGGSICEHPNWVVLDIARWISPAPFVSHLFDQKVEARGGGPHMLGRGDVTSVLLWFVVGTSLDTPKVGVWGPTPDCTTKQLAPRKVDTDHQINKEYSGLRHKGPQICFFNEPPSA